MSVADIIKNGNGTVFSVEIEPPNLEGQQDEIFEILTPLVELGIKYVDITNHPGKLVGFIKPDFPISAPTKHNTIEIAKLILGHYNGAVLPVPHLICTRATKQDSEAQLSQLSNIGVKDIMALRGDPLKDPLSGEFMDFSIVSSDYAYAKELIHQIASFDSGSTKFYIGAACYPEGHPGSNSLEKEIVWLKEKVDAGADYLVTQMFFDADIYARYVEKLNNADITLPIIPGIKPVATRSHLELLPKFFNCSIPNELQQKVERFSDNKDIRKTGIEWCIAQCEKLKSYGAPSLHFYAARKAPIAEVIEALL